MNLYTKNGRPLQVSNNTVYRKSGAVVGRIKGKKVFGKNGQYVGTIHGDRLVYRSTDSAATSGPFAAANRAGIARANRLARRYWATSRIFQISPHQLGVTFPV